MICKWDLITLSDADFDLFRPCFKASTFIFNWKQMLKTTQNKNKKYYSLHLYFFRSVVSILQLNFLYNTSAQCASRRGFPVLRLLSDPYSWRKERAKVCHTVYILYELCLLWTIYSPCISPLHPEFHRHEHVNRQKLFLFSPSTLLAFSLLSPSSFHFLLVLSAFSFLRSFFSFQRLVST